MDIDASARRHGISDDDMTHAFRNAVANNMIDTAEDHPALLPKGPRQLRRSTASRNIGHIDMKVTPQNF